MTTLMRLVGVRTLALHGGAAWRHFTAAEKAARHQRASLLLVATTAAFVAVAYHAALLAHVYQNAHFSGDDVITFCEIAEKTSAELLVTPINEHFVPLHRLVASLVHALAPMSFGVALCVMTAFHVLGVVYLHGTLRLLERMLLAPSAGGPGALCRSQWSWLLIGLYAAHVYLSPLYGWWTAGLHRLPCIAFGLMGTYHYLRARGRKGGADLAIAALCFLVSLGFFVKAVLVPLYLLGLELCLWLALQQPPPKKPLLFLGASLVAAGALLLVWRTLQPPHLRELAFDPRVQRDFFAASAIIIRDGAIGSLFTGGLFGLSAQAPWERGVATVLWLALFAYTVARRPSNLLVWGVLALALVPNVLLVSLSKLRTGSFGAISALVNQRYYFEFYFPIVLFLALAGYRVPRPTTRPALSWLTASVAILVLSLVALNAHASSRQLVKNAQAKHFIERLQTDARRIAQRTGSPIPLVDGGVPAYIVAWPAQYARASVVLPAMGIDVKVTETPGGAYQVLPTGELATAPSRP